MTLPRRLARILPPRWKRHMRSQLYLFSERTTQLGLFLMKLCVDRAGQPPPLELVDDFLTWASDDQFSYAYGARIFDTWRSRIERWRSPLDGLRILEIGPGRSLVTGSLLYACGAARYVAVD